MSEVVVIPDEGSEQVAVVAGAAAATSVQAEQDAREAVAVAEEAQQEAAAAVAEAYDARADVASLREELSALSQNIAGLMNRAEAERQAAEAERQAAEVDQLAEADEVAEVPADGPGKREEPSAPPAPEVAEERKHRYGSRLWFGDRAYH